jgi:hypothetical protein
MVRRKAGVSGRWHDNRHTLITELAESGAGDETIMEIAGHVSRQMLSRYSHIRMEAKRKALAEVDRQRAADKAQRAKERELPKPSTTARLWRTWRRRWPFSKGKLPPCGAATVGSVSLGWPVSRNAV